jgi:hypothetical protein
MYFVKTRRLVDNIIRRYVCCNEVFSVYGRRSFNRSKNEFYDGTSIIKPCSENLYQSVGSTRCNPKVSLFRSSCSLSNLVSGLEKF